MTPELETAGLEPLARTDTQLCLMTSGTCEMFALITRAWDTGRLHVHQKIHPPTELELVTWTDDHGTLQLINLYPLGCTILCSTPSRSDGGHRP